MGLVRRVQIWLILHLWTRVPVRTRVLFFCNDKTVRQRFVWISRNTSIIEGRPRITSRESLLFSSFLGLVMIPMLAYPESTGQPLDWGNKKEVKYGPNITTSKKRGASGTT